MKLAVDFSPLRSSRELRLLLTSCTITRVGCFVTSVAVPFQVYSLTHSSLDVGFLGLVDLAAILSLALVGGALADAVDRRRMILICEAVFLVAMVGLILNSHAAHPSLALLYVWGFIAAGVDSLQRPSLDSMIPRLVRRDDLAATMALQNVLFTVVQLGAPALGGLLIAGAGITSAYLLDFATFAVSLVALSRMKAVPPPADAEKPSVARVLEGLRYARSRQELMGTYLVDMAAMFFGMPLALFPAYAAHLGGPAILGVLYATPAIGSLVASLGSGWVKNVHHHGRAVMASAMVWGAGIACFGAASSLWLALPALAVAGMGDEYSGLFRGLIWNITIPDSLRGRLASIELVSYSSGPSLAGVESGLAVSQVGVRGSGISGGILCIVAAGVLTACLPGFWSYDVREWREAHPEAGADPVVHADAGRITPF